MKNPTGFHISSQWDVRVNWKDSGVRSQCLQMDL